jgi:hypothetical protein
MLWLTTKDDLNTQGYEETEREKPIPFLTAETTRCEWTPICSKRDISPVQWERARKESDSEKCDLNEIWW